MNLHVYSRKKWKDKAKRKFQDPPGKSISFQLLFKSM